LEHAANTYRSDVEVVSAAIKQNGDALVFVDKHANFWGDRESVFSLVKLYGKSLEYADDSLNDDKEVVLAAVEQNGNSLDFASDNLKSSKEVVLVAVRTTPTSLKFALDGLNQDGDCLRASGLWDRSLMTYARNEQVTLSVRFSLARESTDYATNFAIFLKRNDYLKEFRAYNPNAWCKSSCDPVFTDIKHPCRGLADTCQFTEALNLVSVSHGGEKKPALKSCWRFSFRFHLEESKATNGFMIQVQEKHGLGNGQKIETEMAQQAGVKIFRTTTRNEDVSQRSLSNLQWAIEAWYEAGRKAMRTDATEEEKKEQRRKHMQLQEIELY